MEMILFIYEASTSNSANNFHKSSCKKDISW